MTWWRERNREVDFIVSDGRRVVAVEVPSGRKKDGLPGPDAFTSGVRGARPLLVGAQGLPLERVFEVDASDLLAS